MLCLTLGRSLHSMNDSPVLCPVIGFVYVQSDCTCTAQALKKLTFSNQKTEVQGWPFINVF